LPEPEGSPSAHEQAGPPQAAAASGNPLLGRIEVELPDGRYLLVYRHLEPAAADA
jgi:hypothetical protein